jgi:thymidine kinase
MSRIEVICGPMFSGKSEELMRRLNRATIAKRKFQLFKPAVDVRYSEDEVVSHAGQKMKCTPVKFARNILDLVHKDTQIVAIDEAQFFSPQVLDTVLSLANDGLRVVVAGLDMDSDGVPFGPMGNIMAMAESVTKLTAVCEECGEDATHSLRVSEIEGQLLLGEHDHYRAACRRHWRGQ